MDPQTSTPPTATTGAELMVRSANIDDSPPLSSSSSTSLSSTTHTTTNNPDQQPEQQRRPPPPPTLAPHLVPSAVPSLDDNEKHLPPPITPGADKVVFDKGLLFADRPSKGSSANKIVSAPLPSLPPSLPRNNSYPEPSSNNNYRNPTGRNHPLDLSNRPHSHHIPEPRSAPIHLHPNGSNPRIAVSQQLEQQNPGGNNNTNTNNNEHPYTPYSAPAALRPDSVCSFPDSSPVMSPNVLAAVDARLRASASSNTLREPSPLLRQGAFPTNSVRSGSVSKTSSLVPVITHHQALQSSEAIMSREQLYDMLNKDDDEDEKNGSNRRKESGETDATGHYLRTPRPGFAGNGSSTRSSRRNSTVSSTVADSDIELFAIPRKQFSSSTLGKGGPAFATHASAGAGGARGAPYESGSLHDDKDYSDVPMKTEKSAWLENKSSANRKYRSLCCVIGLLLFIGAAVGIALGFKARKDKVDGLAPPPNPDKPTNPLKPLTPPITQFTPDPNLRKAFYGVDYNPAKAMMPWCGATLQPVIYDMMLISQITNRVRLYGMDCNQADLTFQAINALGLNKTMQVVLTIWVDKNQTTYQRQHDTLFQVLDTYGTEMVNGISVGNEVLFREDRTLSELGSLMKAVKDEIKARYGKTIPVFSSDVGSKMTSELAAVSDMLQGNIHPYFSGTPAADAANWTMSEYENKITNNSTPLGLKGVISEVGWPSAPASAVYLKGSVPGLANMQTVVDNFVCQANAAGIPYYWFEFKDEPWKDNPEVPVEPFWGIFDTNGKLKIKIPNCIAP
ncbi:hypothetical protein BG015_000932 [Linnemannia schmuckeri]|uniref:glucan endo-1,3-beta-D-glucosidase n=1 Tax=Linnemannia schmuckeri TaxID=64567 RepID=A0A9P5V745_9FUNG|nr:hypothetical protein BG015_000932 [Linnemannia schmuckeri]